MPYLQSAAIEAITYDETTHRLRTTYRAGDVVVYEEVPQEIYDSLIFAESVSAFFRHHIEGRYPTRRT